MKVLVVRPMEMPEVQEIDHTLSAMQDVYKRQLWDRYMGDRPRHAL